MKNILISTLLPLLFSGSVFAKESYVPQRQAKQLFEKLISAFPSAVSSSKNSKSFLVKNLFCISNEDEFRCSGQNVDGISVLLDADDIQANDSSSLEKLQGLWRSMKKAGLPISQSPRSSHLRIKHLGCLQIFTGPERSIECGFEI